MLNCVKRMFCEQFVMKGEKKMAYRKFRGKKRVRVARRQFKRAVRRIKRVNRLRRGGIRL